MRAPVGRINIALHRLVLGRGVAAILVAGNFLLTRLHSRFVLGDCLVRSFQDGQIAQAGVNAV